MGEEGPDYAHWADDFRQAQKLARLSRVRVFVALCATVGLIALVIGAMLLAGR